MMADPATDEVSLLILAHNKAAHTRLCLEGLLNSTYPRLHFVLVDNGSTDAIPEVFTAFAEQAEARKWRVDILTFAENVGAVSGRNRGLDKVQGRYCGFLDNDVTPRHRDWVERLVAFAEQNPRVGLMQPKLLYPTPPYRIQCAGCDVSPQGKVNFRGRGAPVDEPEFNQVRDCQALISACWLMPAHVLEEVGKLDEQFDPIQFEDIDYAYRVREQGYRAVYVPKAEMYHFENVTSGNTPRLNYTYLTLRNNARFRRKWQHRFSREDGPEAAAMRWESLPTVALEDVAAVPQV